MLGIVDEFIEIAAGLDGKNLVDGLAGFGLVGGGDVVDGIGLVFPTKTERFKAAVFEVNQGFDAFVDGLIHTQTIYEF